MKSIIVENTFPLSLKGQPALDLLDAPEPKEVGLVPKAYPFIKPKLLKKEGEAVKRGEALFFDKQFPSVKFVSPAAGKIKSVVYGERRCIERIVVEPDNSDECISFDPVDNVSKLSAESLKERLLESGMWTRFRAFPFKNIPDPETLPPAVVVSVENDEPFLAQSSVYLEDRFDDFIFGINMLKQLCDKVIVAVSSDNAVVKQHLESVITHQVTGNYPANDPGVVLYNVKEDASLNKAWSITGQSLLQVVTSLRTGKYPTHTVISVGGSSFESPKHYRVRLGMPLFELAKLGLKTGPVRYIAGGLFTGDTRSKDSFLNPEEFGLNLIPDEADSEFLWFMRPGTNKPSHFKTYLSTLMPTKAWDMTTSLNGGERSCVACTACPDVCPVGLYPQFIMKSLKAGDVESAVEKGLLDCTECGLCTYICPSKIELDSLFSEAKGRLYKELISGDGHE